MDLKNRLLNFGANDLGAALRTGNFKLAKKITEHPDFNANEVAFRAYTFKQHAILEYFVQEKIQAPLIENLISAKMLAHRFSLNGEVTLNVEHLPIKIDLGGFHNYYAAHAALHSFEKFTLKPSSTEHAIINQHVLDALHFSTQALKGSDYMERLNQSLSQETPIPIFVPSGWIGHSVGIVIFGNTLFKCNRGNGADLDHGTYIYKINRFEGFSSELFEAMLQTSDPPRLLKYDLDVLLDLEEISRLESPKQTTNNCVWYSTIESIRALLIAESVFQTHQLDQGKALAENIFKAWEQFDLTQSLQTLQMPQDPYFNKIIQNMLVDILNAQHDAKNPHHVARGIEILLRLDHFESALKNIKDMAFTQAIVDKLHEVPSSLMENVPTNGALDFLVNPAKSPVLHINDVISSENTVVKDTPLPIHLPIWQQSEAISPHNGYATDLI